MLEALSVSRDNVVGWAESERERDLNEFRVRAAAVTAVTRVGP